MKQFRQYQRNLAITVWFEVGSGSGANFSVQYGSECTEDYSSNGEDEVSTVPWSAALPVVLGVYSFVDTIDALISLLFG